MAVFTKGVKTPQPRCDAINNRGERCKLHGTFHDNGRTLCVHHRLGGTKLRSLKRQDVPTEIRFIATYTNGMDLQRKDVIAATREDGYRLALERTPNKFRLMNFRKKKED